MGYIRTILPPTPGCTVPTIRVTETIAAPVPAVFDAMSDFENAPARVKEIVKVEMLTPGPVGVGTRFRETRIMFGKEAAETMTVTAFERDTLIQLAATNCGTEYTTRFTFAPTPAGTEIGFELQMKCVSLYAKLFIPLAYLMSGFMKKCVRGDIAQIRAYLESAPRAA